MRWHESGTLDICMYTELCGGRMGCGVGAALVIGFPTEGPRLVTCIHHRLYWTAFQYTRKLGMGMITVCHDLIGPWLFTLSHTQPSQPAIPTYGLTRFSNSKRAEKKKNTLSLLCILHVSYCTLQINHVLTDMAWDLCEIHGSGWWISKPHTLQMLSRSCRIRREMGGGSRKDLHDSGMRTLVAILQAGES